MLSLPLFFLISLLCYLGQAVKLEGNWVDTEKTDRSGVWFFRGALQGEDLFSSLAVSGDWVRKGSYHTAWSVPGDSSRSCSFACGHGTAIGSHTEKRCWALLSWLWRAIAPLMKPWCAEVEVPTAANLNLYRGGNSRVNWHSDNEPLFGRSGVHKLIVFGKLLALLFFSNGRAGPAWTVVSALVGLAMVTFLSWMANAKMSFFTVRVPVWNKSGLMLRTVGLDNILISVLCLRQEWYVVYQHVRKVHPFMLRGILGLAVFGLSCFFFVLCARWSVLGLVFYLLWCTRLGSCWCALLLGRAPRAKVGWGITFMISGKKA